MAFSPALGKNSLSASILQMSLFNWFSSEQLTSVDRFCELKF